MELRDRLAIALDFDDLVMAQRMARLVKPWFGVAKVGLELYTAAGPESVASLVDEGYQVFLDLKLHDIPTTVRRAARVIGALGAAYLTLHAQSGAVMLRAGVDGLHDGAEAAGLAVPTALGVTILTSDADAPPHILGRRVSASLEGGCGGVVCAAADVHEAKQLAPRMLAVVPGIRPAHGERHDQARAATPEEAMAAGADVLVVGRPVTGAPDPAKAAAAMFEALSVALAGEAPN